MLEINKIHQGDCMELNYKIKFFKGIMGEENDYYYSKLKEHLCIECDRLISEGEEYYFPFEDQEMNIAQFPDEYIICKKCKQKHTKIS